MFKRNLSAALVFGLAATAPPAFAQSIPCGNRELITDRLGDSFHEAQLGIGLQSDNRLIEIWSSTESGSWTILLTRPDGASCVLASGQNWLHNTAPTPKRELGSDG